MIIFIDLDGVLADFGKGFTYAWRKKFPQEPLQKRRSFYLTEDYPFKLNKKIQRIYCAKSFFLNLPLIRGSKKALKEIEALGHDVRICTSFISRNTYCLYEKQQWIERHFGHEYVKKALFVKDKTLIKGDLLIDDKPEITGLRAPEWEHIIFDAPYNRHIKNKKRITWKTWKKILKK